MQGTRVPIPGSGRFSGGGHDNPPQYSCLENPMDRGARGVTVHGVTTAHGDCKRVRHNLATKQQHIIERQSGTHESMGNGSIFFYMHAKMLQSCLTLGDLMDCSLPGFSVLGILQARILEQVAMPFSGGFFRHTDGTGISFVCWIGRWVL